MPPIPFIIEVPSGFVDGANVIFEVLTDYVPNTVSVFINGLLRRKDFDDGWSELPPKRVLLSSPPKSGDVVQVSYRPL